MPASRRRPEARLHRARDRRAAFSILLSGGTSTGKTTALNALLKAIPADERILTIEDTRELHPVQPNFVALVATKGEQGHARVTAQSLLEASLRMRPDRIILGEVRGEEAYTFLQAINSGHPGSLSTVHADSPHGAYEQLALKVLMSGREPLEGAGGRLHPPGPARRRAAEARGRRPALERDLLRQVRRVAAPAGHGGRGMRRAALWSFGTAFVLVAAAIVWSLAYAAVTGFAFKTPALLSALTKTDPFVAYKHAVYYWPSAAVQRNALVAAGITAALFVAGWISLFVWRSPTPYGDARFARGGDLFRANLHSKEGLILGWHGSTLLRNDDPRHPLVVGPTRSGKGRGFVIPNLLAWQGSAIVLDIKHENFRETAGARRAAGDEVFMVAPGSARSHCYNPLDFVRRGPEKITDLTNVAHFLIPDPRHGEPIWSQKARDLFVGILGYVLESKEVPDDARTIRTALRLLSTGRDVGAVLKAIVQAESESLSSFVVGRFNQIVAEPPDTRGSVLANLTTALAPWDNQLIAGVTSRSDFDIRLLRRKRMTIYIGPPPSDLEVVPKPDPAPRPAGSRRAHARAARAGGPLRRPRHARRVPAAPAHGRDRREDPDQRRLRLPDGAHHPEPEPARRDLRQGDPRGHRRELRPQAVRLRRRPRDRELRLRPAREPHHHDLDDEHPGHRVRARQVGLEEPDRRARSCARTR